MSDREPVEVICYITHETEEAYLLHDGDRQEWVPKSQISSIEIVSSDEVGNVVEVTMPEWMALKKGFI